MSKKIILLAEDDKSIQLVANDFLSGEGYDVRSAETLKSLWGLIEKGEGDILVTDVMFPDGESFDLIPQIKELRPDLPIIIISARNNLQTAISSVEKGAFEYLPKPFDLNDLNNLITKALLIKPKLNMKSLIRKKSNDLIIGSSKSMQEMYRVIGRLSQNDLTVMIYGESGTGKELVSKALHIFGKRSDHPFIAVNMAAIPSELIESELFGHEKGAFTGAISARKGRFELAQGGTLFLDEIGDMPLQMQVKLLRVLQERSYERVGGTKAIQADVRVIAATHRNLETMIEEGSFREDLYYRLNVFPIENPSLSERADDIPLLLKELMRRVNDQTGSTAKFTERAVESLKEHAWPGNIRELANLVERMVIMFPEKVVDIPDLPNKYRYIEVEAYEPEYPEELMEKDAFNDIFSTGFSDYESEPDAEFSQAGSGLLPDDGIELKDYLAELEISLITQALERYDYVVARAAEILGVRRTTLVEKMKKYNLSRD